MISANSRNRLGQGRIIPCGYRNVGRAPERNRCHQLGRCRRHHGVRWRRGWPGPQRSQQGSPQTDGVTSAVGGIASARRYYRFGIKFVCQLTLLYTKFTEHIPNIVQRGMQLHFIRDEGLEF